MAEPIFPPTPSDLTLGRRLNNPLNIRQNNQGFLGEAGDESGFVRFESPEYGLRAADRILNTYGRDYGINTLEALVNRFAPPSENDSGAYLDFVSSQTGIGAQDEIDLTDPQVRGVILPAMARIESRSDITPEMLGSARSLDQEPPGDQEAVSEQQALETILKYEQEADKKPVVTQVTAPWGSVYEITHPASATERDIFRYVQMNRDKLDAVEQAPQEELGLLETGVEIAKAPFRGLASGLLSVPAGIAELADAATNTVGLEGLIDSGEENALVALSRAGQEAISDSFLARDPRAADSFAVDVAEGLGSVATFLTPGVIGRVAGLTGNALKAAATRGGMAFGTGFGAEQQQQMIAEARAQGIDVSEGQEDLATALGGVIGLSEVALPFRLFGRIKQTAPQAFKDKAIFTIKEALKSGSTEAVQEAMAGIAQEAVAKGVYDETISIGDSFAQDFTVGGGVGVVADLITSAVGGRRSNVITDIERRKEEELRQKRDAEISRMQQERVTPPAQKVAESVASIDPASIEPKDLSRPSGISQYAIDIARTMGYSFPERVRFNVQATGDGAMVVDENGVQYGVMLPDPEQAFRLAGELNEQLVDQAVRNNVLTAIDLDANVPEDNMSTALEYGRRVLAPSENTVNGLVLNDLAGTTQANGYLEFVLEEDGTPVAATLAQARRRKRKLTAEQRLNAERRKKGLPETTNFTMEEVRSVLGDEIGGLVDRAKLSPGVRSVLTKKKQGENKIRRLLQSKNITSDLNAPEMKPVFKALVGKESLSDFNGNDRALLYQRLSQMPRFAEPQKLPDFQPRIFTAEQVNRVIDAGAPATVDEVLEAARIPETDPDRVKKAEAIIEAVKAKGLEPSPTLLLPAPEDYKSLVDAARANLDQAGLKDIGVRIVRSLEEGVEGQFDPVAKQISVAVEAIDPDGTLDEATRNQRIADVMGHETLHALREYDLFEQNEWSSLESAAVNLQRPDGAGTYLDYAMANYPELSATEQIEEAVSEIVRDGLQGRLPVAGRPRSLIQRIVEFFKNMGSAIGMSKVDSLEGVIKRIETGEVAGRERGKIRTLLRTEQAAGLVPTRLSGDINRALAEGTLDQQAVQEMINRGVQRQVESGNVSPADPNMVPAWIPRTKDARVFSLNKDPITQKQKAEKAGFDPTFAWYHGTLTERLIDEEVRLGLPTGFLGRGFYLTSSIYDAENNYASVLGPDQANKISNERDVVSDVIYQEVLEGEPGEMSLGFFDKAAQIKAAADDIYGDWEIATREDIENIGDKWREYDPADFEADIDPAEVEEFLSNTFRYKGPDADIFNAALDRVAADSLGFDSDGLVFPLYTKGRFAVIGQPDQSYMEGAERFITPPEIDASPEEFAQIVVDLIDESYTLENPDNINTFFRNMEQYEADGTPMDTNQVYEVLRNSFGGGVTLNPEEQDALLNRVGSQAEQYLEGDVRGDLIARTLQELGFDGVDMAPGSMFPNMDHVEGQLHRIVFNLPSVRSIDADFDPARATEPRLLASRRNRVGIAEQKRREAAGEVARVTQQNTSGRTEAALTSLALEDNIGDEMDALTENEPKFFGFQAPTYGIGNRILFNIADKFLGLKQIEESIDKKRREAGLPPLQVSASPYKGEESIPGKVGFEVRQFNEGEKQKLVETIVELDLSLPEVDEFLILRHAIERNAQVRRVNPDIQDAGAGSLNGKALTDAYVKQRMAQEYGMTLNENGVWVGGNEKGQRLKRVAEEVSSITKRTIDRAKEGGLYSAQDADLLKNFYRYYVPLKGFNVDSKDPIDIPRPGTAGAGGSMNVRGPEGRRAMGRESEAFSPLATIIADRERTIARATKNKEFGQKLVKFIRENPSPDYWEVFPPGTPVYTRMLNAKNQTVEVRGLSPDFAGQDGEFMGVKIGGEQWFVRINGDERLRKALMNLDADSNNFLVNNLGRLNRFLSMVNTSLNPEFVIGNFARDIQTAVYNIVAEETMAGGRAEGKKIVKQVVADTLPSIRKFYRGLTDINKLTGQDRRDFEQFMAAGAKADWFHSRPPEEAARTFQSMIDMQKGTLSGGFQKAFSETRDFIDDMNSAVENGVRFASFKKARDAFLQEGVPEAEAIARAATLAKNLTVNFNRKGMQGNLLNSLYLFFNASVQGTVNFARGLNVFDPDSSRTKQAMVGSMVGFGALSAMLAHSMSDEDEESGRTYYELIPDYIKERNIVIMAPRAGANTKNTYVDANGDEYEGKQHYYTIPLPYGYNVFHVAGAMLYESNAGIRSNANAAGMTTGAFLGSFNPIGFSSSNDFFTSVIKTGVPTAGLPVVELLANENFFGAPIYRENLPFGTNVPDSQLSFSTTPEAFKIMAGFLNSMTGGNESEPGFADISPDSLAYMYEYALGGAGATAMRAFEFGRRVTTGEDVEYNQIPFLRRAIGEPQVRPLIEDYYDRKESIQRKVRQAEDVLTGQERVAYIQKNRDYLGMEGILKNFDSRLTRLRKELRDVQGFAAQSPEAAIRAQDRIERIEEEIDRQYAQFNKLFDERVGRTK